MQPQRELLAEPDSRDLPQPPNPADLGADRGQQVSLEDHSKNEGPTPSEQPQNPAPGAPEENPGDPGDFANNPPQT